MDDRVHPLRGTALALRPTQAFLLGVRVEERLAGVTQSPRRLVGGLEAPRSTWTHAPSLHTPTYAGCWKPAAPPAPQTWGQVETAWPPGPAGCGCRGEWELHGLAVGMGGMGVGKL